MDYWVQMALAILFSVLKETVRDKKKKENLRRAMEKLRDHLMLAYPLDEIPDQEEDKPSG